MSSNPTHRLFEAVRAFLIDVDPTFPISEVHLIGSNGDRICRHVQLDLAPPPPEAFVPTPFQAAILDALEGKAMRTDALGAAVGDRSRLFRRPGGLPELREQGLVCHHSRLGFYRPDAPPENLEQEIS